MENKNVAKVFLIILGVCTSIVVLESLPVVYPVLIFSLIGGPLILLVAILFILLGIGIIVLPFRIGYRLYQNSKFFAVIVTSSIGLILLIVTGIYLFQKDRAIIRERNEYKNQIKDPSTYDGIHIQMSDN